MSARGSIVGCLPRDAARALLIRELGPADRPALRFMFGRLGDDSRYQRFLGVKHALSAPELRYLTDLDHWHRDAVIAWSPAPRAPIGVARYVRSDEFDLAEIAVTVVDAWQRRGVGRLLLLELRERALRAGIHRFVATMFGDNKGALALARWFGPTEAVRRCGGVVELSGSWREVPAAGATRDALSTPACSSRPGDRQPAHRLLHIAYGYGAEAPARYLCGAPVRALIAQMRPGHPPRGNAVCPVCAFIDGAGA